MTERTCPICEEPIGKFEKVGPITYELEPCGHQIDERVHSDLFEG